MNMIRVFALSLMMVLATSMSTIPIQHDLNNAAQLVELLEQSHIGRIVLQLSQLKSKAQQFDFSKLYKALDDLDAGLRERIQVENDSLQQSLVQYTTDANFYSNQVTQFSNEVATHNIDIEDLNGARERSEESLQGKKSELFESLALSARVRQSMEGGDRVFTTVLNQYTGAVAALDAALELLAGARDGSFVQLESVQSAAENLSNTLGELHHRRVMHKPLVEALLQVATENFVNAEQLGRVIRLLQELRENLSASRTALINAQEAQNTQSARIMDEYAARNSNLQNVVIPQVQADLDSAVAELSTKNQLMNDAQSNLNAAETNNKAVEDRWIQRQAQNKALVDGYNNELQVVSQAIVHLERAGIRRN